MSRTHFILPCTALLAWAVAPLTFDVTAWAATCATEPITARGETSRYEWLAKTKARANWRRKVRATPGLGSAYDNWYAATDTQERCLSGKAGTLCIFTGRPCTK